MGSPWRLLLLGRRLEPSTQTDGRSLPLKKTSTRLNQRLERTRLQKATQRLPANTLNKASQKISAGDLEGPEI